MCFSGGKILQLQPFVLCEPCLDLLPESAQTVSCRQNTQPLLLSLCSLPACWGAWKLTLLAMWCSLDLGASHPLHTSVRSTSCPPSLPEAWQVLPGEKNLGERRENPRAIKPLPGEDGECGGRPGALPGNLQLLLRSCLLVRVPGLACLFPSLCACSDAFCMRQLLGCFS